MKNIPICRYCGKPHKKNPHILEGLPDFIKEKIIYIPDCDCLEIQKEKELEELEKKRVEECKLNRIKRFRDISLIDEKFRLSTFERADMSQNYIKIARAFAEKFIEKGTAPKGILFYGGVGTGKTYASSCIGNYLMDSGKTVVVMNMGLYIGKIQREWAEAEKDLLSYIKDSDLLIIDDFGAEKISEFVIEKTFAMIDTRCRALKPLIITTNLNIEEIGERFGARIADRISEMCFPILVTGMSKRGVDTKREFMEFLK